MKRNLTLLLAAILIGGTAFGQAVKDRNVIPVAVNLNQVLRMTITNGGNIEFVFNSIDDYRDGLSGAAATSGSANPAGTDDIYQTDFTIASSTRWELTYGSEEADFIGTDNPGNTLLLDNVGFTIESTGSHAFETSGTIQTTADEQIWLPTINDEGAGNPPVALTVYPTVLMTDNTRSGADQANAGDGTDNDFTIYWRCGTAESTNTVTPMNASSILDQATSPDPDRYVTNVVFELAAIL